MRSLRSLFRRLRDYWCPRPPRCCYCAAELEPGEVEICYHHLTVWPAEVAWPQENRIYCDFIHRARAWDPLPRAERLKDDWDPDLYEELEELSDDRQPLTDRR